MAKQKRDAVGTTALDAYFITTAETPAEIQTDKPEPNGEEIKAKDSPRFTVRISSELQDRVRRACYWERETVTAFVERAFEAELAKMEEDRGEPYPPMAGTIKRGRPVGS